MNEEIFSGYVNLRGHRTWCKEWKNNGEPALLLHGGLSATQDWDTFILPAIENTHHVFAYDRTAHGRTGIQKDFYNFDIQRDEAIAFLEDVVKEPAHLLGWSDGGIIALMIAIKRPDLVKTIVAIGTNFNFDAGFPADFAEPEINISEEDRQEFAERSPDPAYIQEVVIRKAFEVWKVEPTMTTMDLGRITCPVLVLTGDDEPFSNHHTIELYESLPQGRLAIIPAASHYVVKERTELMNTIIKDFFQNLDYPVTKWPRLRASS
jgi:pimeloyl-ACP methyl ester carboxylesterase